MLPNPGGRFCCVELEELGSIFASSMDSEVIVHRLARSTAQLPEERLADATGPLARAVLLIAGLARGAN